jgi:hypothetical protein
MVRREQIRASLLTDLGFSATTSINKHLCSVIPRRRRFQVCNVTFPYVTNRVELRRIDRTEKTEARNFPVRVNVTGSEAREVRNRIMEMRTREKIAGVLETFSRSVWRPS